MHLITSTLFVPTILFYFVIIYLCFFFFFFSSRRRHTRCLSDWSSDVCSSDLVARVLRELLRTAVSQELAKDSSDGAIPQLALLKYFALAREVEFNDVALNADVLRSKRSYSVAAVLTRIDLAARPHKAGRQNSQDASHHSLAIQSLFSKIAAHRLS